jgi:ferredoxin
MIRYEISDRELRQRIEEHSAGWLSRAEEQTDKIRKSKKKPRFLALWSEIKDVYSTLQHSKCAFCERCLEEPPYGRIEQDVEHFRPKSRVTAWKVPGDLLDAGVQVSQPADGTSEPGYALLAYSPLNYAIACKPCNSILKKNLFPIAGDSKSAEDNPAALASERPYLIYPISDLDDDPEDLIEYYGLSPRPKKKRGFGRLRALVTIEIFKLDRGKPRAALMKGRARQLQLLYFALRLRSQSRNSRERRDCDQVIQRLTTSDAEEHANCLRSFFALYQRKPQEAQEVYEAVREFLSTISP